MNDVFLQWKEHPQQLQRSTSDADDAGCHWHAIPEEICTVLIQELLNIIYAYNTYIYI